MPYRKLRTTSDFVLDSHEINLGFKFDPLCLGRQSLLPGPCDVFSAPLKYPSHNQIQDQDRVQQGSPCR